MDMQTLIVGALLVSVLALLAIGVIWTIKITNSLPSDLDTVFYEHGSIKHKKHK